jgi:hypothetical protein
MRTMILFLALTGPAEAHSVVTQVPAENTPGVTARSNRDPASEVTEVSKGAAPSSLDARLRNLTEGVSDVEVQITR